jgi:F-box/leucine-rich repeat protein 2/20
LKELQEFNLSDNPNITDDSIMSLVNRCHNLENIYINNCPKLTDASLFSIGEHCPNLKEISVSIDNIKTTMIGVIELVSKCRKLNSLYIGSDNSLPSGIQEELKRRFDL